MLCLHNLCILFVDKALKMSYNNICLPVKQVNVFVFAFLLENIDILPVCMVNSKMYFYI